VGKLKYQGDMVMKTMKNYILFVFLFTLSARMFPNNDTWFKKQVHKMNKISAEISNLNSKMSNMLHKKLITFSKKDANLKIILNKKLSIGEKIRDEMENLNIKRRSLSRIKKEIENFFIKKNKKYRELQKELKKKKALRNKLKNKYKNNDKLKNLLSKKEEYETKIENSLVKIGKYDHDMQRILQKTRNIFIKKDIEYHNLNKKVIKLRNELDNLIKVYNSRLRKSKKKKVVKHGDIPVQPAVGSGSRTESP